MNIIIETERLILRTFTKDDASLIYELNQDPEVIKYTLDPMHDLAHAQEVLEQVILPQYELYHHGRWATHTKEDGHFIGWCGLKYRPELNEVDLGYRFIQSTWGKGYATESAKACIQYGFERLGLQHIVGRALPENLASVKVLEKCGMTYRGEEIVEGLLHKTYDIYNPLIQS